MARTYTIAIETEVDGTQEVNQLNRALGDTTEAAEDAQKSLDQLSDVEIDANADKAVKSMKNLGDEAKKSGDKTQESFDGIRDSAVAATTGIDALENTAAGAGQSIASASQQGREGLISVRSAAEATGRSMTVLEDQFEETIDDIERLRKQQDALTAALDRGDITMEQWTERWHDLGNEINRLRGVAAGVQEDIGAMNTIVHSGNQELFDFTETAEKATDATVDAGNAFGKAGDFLVGAFGGAAFAIVNRIVDALVNIKPVAEAVEDVMEGIDITVRTLTGDFDDLFDELEQGGQVFNTFGERVRAAKEEVADLNKEIALFELAEIFTSAEAARLLEQATKFEEVFTDTDLPLAEREQALEAWRQLHLDVIDRTAADIDTQRENLTRQLTQTGLLGTIEDLESEIERREGLVETHQQRLADAETDFQRRSALGAIGTQREILSRLRVDLDEAVAEAAPMQAAILALDADKDELGRRRLEVLQRQLVFLDEVKGNIERTLLEINRLDPLTLVADDGGLLFPDRQMIEDDMLWFADRQRWLGDTVAGSWISIGETIREIQFENLTSTQANAMLGARVLADTITNSLAQTVNYASQLYNILAEYQGNNAEEAAKAAKKQALTNIVLDTISGSLAAFASAQTYPAPYSWIIGGVAAALVNALGIAAYQKALTADYSTSPSGIGATGGLGVVPTSSIIGVPDDEGLKSASAGQIPIGGEAGSTEGTLKATVVGSDVTTTQAADRYATSNAVF